MQGFQRIYLIFIIGILSFFLYSCTGENPKKSAEQVKDKPAKYAKKNQPLELSEQLYAAFSNNRTRTGDSDIETPDYFGGSYLDDGKLVILIKGMNEDGIQDIYSKIGRSPLLKFKGCKYSLQELKDYQEHLAFLDDRNNKIKEELGWISVGLMPMENRIIVYLKDASPQNILKFKKQVSDSDMIIFAQSSELDLLD